MEIKLDVKLKTMDMYNFFMYHSYTRFSGLLSIHLGAAMAVLLVSTYNEVQAGQSLMYFLFCLFFLIYNPVAFYLRALKQIKTAPLFQKPITYKFDSTGIQTIQGGESAKVKWENILKVVETRRCIIVYLSKVRASVIPKESIGSEYTNLTDMIKKYVDKSKVKIK